MPSWMHAFPIAFISSLTFLRGLVVRVYTEKWAPQTFPSTVNLCSSWVISNVWETANHPRNCITGTCRNIPCLTSRRYSGEVEVLQVVENFQCSEFSCVDKIFPMGHCFAFKDFVMQIMIPTRRSNELSLGFEYFSTSPRQMEPAPNPSGFCWELFAPLLCRRAHLRDCLELLKELVPSPPDHQKATTLALLQSAEQYIKVTANEQLCVQPEEARRSGHNNRPCKGEGCATFAYRSSDVAWNLGLVVHEIVQCSPKWNSHRFGWQRTKVPQLRSFQFFVEPRADVLLCWENPVKPNENANERFLANCCVLNPWRFLFPQNDYFASKKTKCERNWRTIFPNLFPFSQEVVFGPTVCLLKF